MKEIKIIMKSDISINDIILNFKRDITTEMAGHIIQYIAKCESEEKRISKLI